MQKERYHEKSKKNQGGHFVGIVPVDRILDWTMSLWCNMRRGFPEGVGPLERNP